MHCTIDFFNWELTVLKGKTLFHIYPLRMFANTHTGMFIHTGSKNSLLINLCKIKL